MSKKYEIRPYRSGDEEGIVELLQLVFDGWPRFDLKCNPIDHWRWKYTDNPLKTICIAVALNQNKIIGCQHGVLHTIKIRDEVFLGCLVGDLAVHQDFRRMGVFTKMNKFWIELREEIGSKLDHYISGNPIIIKKYLKIRPQFPHPLSNLVRIWNIDEHLKAMPLENVWLIKLGFHALNLTNSLKNAFSGSIKIKPDIHISDIRCFDDRIDEFWKRISEDYSFILKRSRNYLNWRYCDPRAGDFVVKQAEEDDRILGYSVIKINKYLRDYPVGFVVDLLTLPDRLDAAEALVADTLNSFDSNNVNIVNYLVVKNHPLEGVFKRFGFLDSRIKIYLLYSRARGRVAEDMKMLETHPASRVFFSWGDHDSLPLEKPS